VHHRGAPRLWWAVAGRGRGAADERGAGERAVGQAVEEVVTEGVVRGRRGHVTWAQACSVRVLGSGSGCCAADEHGLGVHQARMRTVRAAAAAIPASPASAAGSQGKMRAPSRTILIPAQATVESQTELDPEREARCAETPSVLRQCVSALRGLHAARRARGRCLRSSRRPRARQIP
jgi:hypothetical protein